jgi:hypothetical protein
MAAGALSSARPLTAGEAGDASAVPDRRLVDLLRGLRPRHPRLHLSAADAVRFRQGGTGERARYARMLLEWVDRNRDWSPLARPFDKKFGNTVLEEEGAFITNAALAYVVSGRPEHLQLARRRALAMCDWPKDGSDYYSLGVFAAALARAYDWLYSEWKPAEIERIRAHLARIIQALHDGSYAGGPKAQWWAVYPLHHDYWIPVGGFGEAALALLGEVPEAAAWAVRARQLFDVSFGWLGQDGAWHEGVGDWCYALAPLLMFFGAWQSAVGENLHERPWLRHTARFRLYHWLPNDRYVGLNDSFRDGRYGPTGAASCHLLRRLASLFRDGHAQWLASRDEVYDLRRGAKGVQRAPHEQLSYRDEAREDLHADAYPQAWNLLWYDESVSPKAPAGLPLACHFPNQGGVIARTGWDDPGATVVSLQCGPLGGQRCAERIRKGEGFAIGNLSHAHAAYNSFTLFSRGEYFVVPPGYARRGSRFQNTVAVNGAEFLTDPALPIRIEAFRSERAFSYCVGDAGAAFPADARVAHYRRHLLLWHADAQLFIFDDLRLREARAAYWNSFQWSLHTDPRSHRVTTAGRRLVCRPIDRVSPNLTVQIFEPEEFAWEHGRLASLDGVDMLEAHRLVRPEWYSDRMRVLAGLSMSAGPHSPLTVRHAQFLAVATDSQPGQTLVGFALVPLGRAALDKLSHPALAGRELLLFGHDPGHPDAFVSIQDGKVR